MKNLKRIDFIVIVFGVMAPLSHILIIFLYQTEILGHNPINPLEMYGFLQYAWPIIGAIALAFYFAALRHIVRPITIITFVLLLLLAGGLSWVFYGIVLSIA